MLIFKSGNGTTLTGYKLSATSGSYSSPFTEPPFNFPGNGPKDISHISLYVRVPGQAVPEPLTMLGASAAIGFGAAFKRKLAQKKDSNKA